MKQKFPKAIVRAITIIFAIVMYEEVSAQGCSDAGFCSLGNLHVQRNDSMNVKNQKLSLYLPYGIGDDDVKIFTPGIEYSIQVSKQWNVQTKLTVNSAKGKLGNASGFGDIFISGTYTVKSKSRWTTSLMLGTKLPLSNSNLKADGKSLPMQYQSSLGTFDLITGLSLSNRHWQFATGWQQPFSGTNNNNFLPADWNTADAQNYPPSRNLKRRGDVLLRSAYSIELGRKLNFNVGVLGIYHLNDDEFTDQTNTPNSIMGSEGLTVNVTLAGWFKLSNSITVGFTSGTPLVVREVRPDGLTRSFVFAPEISWKF